MINVVGTTPCYINLDHQHSFDEYSVTYEFVRQYFTVLTEAPEHVWRFYANSARYCCVHADGTKIVANGRSQLHDVITGPAIVLVSSVHAVQCVPNRLLVMVTTDRFVQSFAIDFNPQSMSFVVVASIVQHFSDATEYVHSAIDLDEHSNRGSSNGGSLVKDYPSVDRASDRCGAIVLGDCGNEYERVYADDPERYYREDDNRVHRDWDDGKKRRGATRYRNGSVRGTADSQLFIGHLMSSTTETDVRKTCSEYGNVVNVRVLKGYNRTGKPANYNYAFVQFDDPKPVENILANRPLTLCNGNRVNVHRSKRHNNYKNASDVITG